MSQAPTSVSTIGEQLRNSPALESAIAAAVDEIKAKSEQITDCRPPAQELAESYQALMDRAGATRGRGLMYPYIGSGLGNGALVELADGSVKWDMIAGIGVHYFGHSDPELIEAAFRGAVDDTIKHGNLQSNMEAFEFSETILAEAARASNFKVCFLSTSGAMANENALKICFQKHAPANRVLAFADCFMGRSMAMSLLGDAAGNRQGIPLNMQVDYMPFYDEVEAQRVGQAKHIETIVVQLKRLIERYPGQYACFVFELVQGEGGFNTAPPEFFKALMECCKNNNIAVWADEIQTFGRTEKMFMYEHLGIGEYIDVMCIGKMSQACATLFTEDYNPKPGLLSGTFTGETVSFTVGKRTVERLRDGGYYGPDGINARHHRLFCEQVRALAAKHPDWFPDVPEVVGQAGVKDICGGLGGMMRFTPFGGKKEPIVKACRECFDEGVVVFYCGHGPFHIRMLPPLGVMKEEDWPRVFEVVERGLAKAAD